MSFEDRIRQAVGRALDDVRARMEQEVRALVQELAASAAEERQLAIARAREQTLSEGREQADQRVAEAEAHLTATIDRVVADACAREREQASAHARRVMEIDADARAGRLIDAVRALDAATTSDDVLDALAAAIRLEAGRTGVFLVRGTSFHGWSLSGFGGLDAQPAQFAVPIAEAPLVQEALHSGRLANSDQLTPAASVAVPGAAGAAIAVPLLASGRVVAVVYADTLTAEGREAVVSRAWASTIELLARHAARCLAAVLPARDAFAAPVLDAPVRVPAPASLARRAAPIEPTLEASARRLARLLLEEIKLHNEPSVDAGRRAGDLLMRLAPQVERARRVYDARVPAALPSRAQLFQQELVATLADGDATRLGVPA